MKYLWPLFTLIIAVLLFISSNTVGEASGTASMGLLERIKEWLPFLARFDVDFLHFLVRKAAHFVAYSSMGFCMAHSLKYHVKGYRWWLTAWGSVSIYGVLDELHQFFIPGRAMLVSDMILNAASAFLGICVVWLYLKRRRLHIVEK
jgi:VanZ family protein